MVVFTDGMPDKQAYRKFAINTIRGSNDPAMMAEMVSRRFRDAKHADWPKPDLIILDGGKGQLSVVRHSVGKHIAGVPICALAKREEELFVPDREQPVRLREGSDGYHLIQRIRDEAHRFAIGFYRSKHSRASTVSVLDEITGIGPKTKKMLLTEFGSVQGIREASRTKIAKLIGSAKMKKLFEAL